MCIVLFIVGVCSDLLCLLLRVWSKCAISLPDDSVPHQRGGSPIGIDGASWVGMCMLSVGCSSVCVVYNDMLFWCICVSV